MNPREPKELLIASKAFAVEDRMKSWWCLGSTLAVQIVLFTIAVSDLPWLIRLPCSLAAGFVHVRLFVIYHDFQHGAILKSSMLAKCLLGLYGLLSLNPPNVWARSHDHHHRHNSRVFGLNVGSYPIYTTTTYERLSWTERLAYNIARHPLTMFFGYFTVFLWGMTIRPFCQSPIRHFDALFALLVHYSTLTWLAMHGLDVMLLGLGLPLFVAAFVGAYLFYAQHNFPDAKLRRGAEWSHVDAALHASSFIPMGSTMRWLTGNIGFHHVHHLNANIPFYRLPDAMDALVELQQPGTTTLSRVGIRSCLRLKLWDVERDCLVGFDD